MKSKTWGHIYVMKSEKLRDAVETFWPYMGHGWSQRDCENDIQKAKTNGHIGKTAKPVIYRVELVPVNNSTEEVQTTGEN